MKFIVDFKIPIKKDKVIELFKKSNCESNTNDLNFDEFITFMQLV